MKLFKPLSLLIVAGLVFFTSCKDEDEKFDIDYAEAIPRVEKTTIAVDEELEIEFSSTDTYDFSYEITEGEDYVTVIEHDGSHYIKGVEPGDATLILSNNVGEDTVNIEVVAIPAVEKTIIEVGDELEISNSSTTDDSFSYEVTEGEEFVSVIEQNGLHYIKGLKAGDATLILTNNAGSTTVTIDVMTIPAVEKTTIGVNEEMVISSSNTEKNEFSYEITDGEDFVTVVEQDGMHYIKGTEPGEATLTLTNSSGSATVTINVISEVELVDELYIDYQGIRYDIDMNDNTASVAKDSANVEVDFTSFDGKVIIPANIYYEGTAYPVTSVGYKSFSSATALINTTVKSVYFAKGSNIISIDDNAFERCENLESLDLSNCTSLDSIGSNSFYSCGKLLATDFSSCTSLTKIKNYAFAYNTTLTSVDLTECTSLNLVDVYAFSYGNSAISVALPGDPSEWNHGTNVIDSSFSDSKFTR